MTARIEGFVTRAQAGLRPPRSISRNVDPSRGGVAFHWGGPSQRLRNHDECVARWKAWQTFHMDSRGWTDIAYNGGVCSHGYALAGRGWGIRSAANGTNDGNSRFLAVCWLGGEGEATSEPAIDAFEWWVQEFRRLGAGDEVRPHKAFKSTSCPGPDLSFVAATLDRQPITRPLTPTEEAFVAARDSVRIVQQKGGTAQYAFNAETFSLLHLSPELVGVYKALGVPTEPIPIRPADVKRLPKVGVA